MKKRITAILLTFAMVVTAVPTTAFVSAEELEVVETITPDEAVVEEAAPAEVVAEPEAPVEDAVIVEDAVVVEPEAPAAVAEDDLDIVAEVVEDGAAEEIAAEASVTPKKLEDMEVTVTFSNGVYGPVSGVAIKDSGYALGIYGSADPYETYDKEIAKNGACPKVKISWMGKSLEDDAYTLTYEDNKNATTETTNSPVGKATIKVSWNRKSPDLADKDVLPDIPIYFMIKHASLNGNENPGLKLYVEGKEISEYDEVNTDIPNFPVPEFKYPYDGKPHTVEMTLRDKGYELVYEEDYTQTVFYSQNIGENISNSTGAGWSPNITDMAKPGTYVLYANDGAVSKNYDGAVRGGAPVATWIIEKAEFNNTNISTPKIVLYEDDFDDGKVTLDDAYTEIRERVHNKLTNMPWETAGTHKISSHKCEYVARLYDVDQDTGIRGDATKDTRLKATAKGQKYEYAIELQNSTYFEQKDKVEGRKVLLGELWVVSGTAPFETIIENRSDAIDEALKTVAVYDGSDLKLAIKEKIADVLKTYPGLNGMTSMTSANIKFLPDDAKTVVNAGTYQFRISAPKGSKWDGKTCDYTVTVQPKQMAESKSAGRYTTFAAGYDGKAEQYVHMDKSAGMVDVTIVDNTSKALDKTLKKGKDFEVYVDEGYFNDYVYIKGINNYKTTRGNEDVLVKVAVQQTGKVNLSDSKVKCVVYNGETQPYSRENYVVKTDDIYVYEELNGKEYKIPDDCWTVTESDCTDNKHRSEGQHWIVVKGRDEKGYAKTARGSFRIGGGDINDDFTAELTKDTFELTDKPVTLNDLGIKVQEIVQSTANVDWQKYFYIRITYDWEGVTYTLTSEPRNIWPTGWTYWYSLNETPLIFKHAVPHTVELIPRKSEPRVEGYSGTLKPGTFNVVPRKFKEWSEQNRQNRIIVSSKETTIVWPGRPVNVSDFARAGVKVSDAVIRTADGKDTPLTLGKDYTVEYVSGGTKAGEDAKFILHGLNDYSEDTIEVAVKVVKFNLSAIKDNWARIADQPYWGGKNADVPEESIGNELYVYMEDPDVAEKEKRVALRMPTDAYEVKCVDATVAGRWGVGDRVEVSIAPKDTENYAGSWTKVAIFNIAKANIGNTKLFEVSGVPAVKAGETPVLDNVVLKDTRNGYELKLTDEYTKAFKQNEGVGEGTLVLTAAGQNYVGTTSAPVKRTLEGGSIDPIAAQTYDGTAKEPTVTVKDAVGDVVDPADYEITYSNNTNAGTAGVTVTVKDTSKSYTGTLTGTFEIQKAANSLTVSPTTIYVAPEEKLPLTVTSDAKGEVVFESADKTVAIVDKDGNVTGVKAGATTTVKVTAGGKNYEAKEATVTVVVKQPTVITAVDKRVVWTGAAQSIDLGAKASSGAALTYTVTDAGNAKGGISVVNGKASVTADFMGEAKVTISAPNTDGYQAATKTISVKVSPEDIKVLQATSKNGKIVVKYSTTNSATKYQLQIADNASFKNARTIKSKMWGDPNKRTVKTKIKKGNTYYVRVRACNKVGKVLFHSVNWSKAVAVKVR